VLAARAKCIYKVQREAIATARHALKLLASRCFGERRGNDELRRLYAHRAGASSARVARNSFSLVYPLVPLPFRARQRVLSLSRDEPNSCSRFDMSLALPARFGRSVPRLPTRPFIHGSFSLCPSFLSPSSSPLLSLHRRVIHVCIHVRSPSFLRRPPTHVLSSSGSV